MLAALVLQPAATAQAEIPAAETVQAPAGAEAAANEVVLFVLPVVLAPGLAAAETEPDRQAGAADSEAALALQPAATARAEIPAAETVQAPAGAATDPAGIPAAVAVELAVEEFRNGWKKTPYAPERYCHWHLLPGQSQSNFRIPMKNPWTSLPRISL